MALSFRRTSCRMLLGGGVLLFAVRRPWRRMSARRRTFHGACCGGANVNAAPSDNSGNHGDRATPGRTTAGPTAIGDVALRRKSGAAGREPVRGFRQHGPRPAVHDPGGGKLADQHARRDNRRRRRPDGRHHARFDGPWGPARPSPNGVRRALDVGLFDIDRIEVLRGPQGTLYGASSIGGVLKYVTRSPSLTDFDGSVRAGLSDTRSGAMDYNGSAVLNAPIVVDKAAVRASGFYSRVAGYTDNS